MSGGDRPDDWATALADVINAPGDEGELKKKREAMERRMAPDEERQDDAAAQTL